MFLGSNLKEILIEKGNLKIIFDCVGDGIFTHDSQMRITSFNRTATQVTGFSQKEALGKRCVELFGRALCRERCLLAQTFKTNETVKNQEVKIIAKDGKEKTIVLNTAILWDKEKKSRAIAVIFRDISELVSLKQELKGRYRFHNLVGKNYQMQEIYQLIEEIAESNATVLIQGESGTGKELVAKAIHYQSLRADRPFIKVDCSSLAENLLESELFGHVKGAFTGAIRDKMGRFELANGGTIFLDEIGEISPALQVKLLRVLQDREMERVGDTRTIKVDVRIIAATNQDLKKLVREKKFREDLFYRLYVIPITLPPLRKRKEDIPLLAEHFLQKFRKENKKEIKGISLQVIKLFMDYDWKGNVRELENVLEHAVVKCHGKVILPESLPKEFFALEEKPLPSKKRRREFEDKELFLSVLKETGWNKTRAAKKLGIGRTTLWRKIKELNLSSQ